MATAAHLPPQLTPISVLLDAFNHRNKNQHRRSHWWRQFNLLRRAVRRLIVAPRAQGSATLPHHVKWVAENVIPSSYMQVPTQRSNHSITAPHATWLLPSVQLYRRKRLENSFTLDDPGGDMLRFCTPAFRGPFLVHYFDKLKLVLHTSCLYLSTERPANRGAIAHHLQCFYSACRRQPVCPFGSRPAWSSRPRQLHHLILSYDPIYSTESSSQILRTTHYDNQ